jgi:alpha-amylase/alpha-mannosidase (GH57 family)
MSRYLCIHGHFYQPPRENPWLEAIELQDSAYPYHDWNERITAECYGPNAVSRILDRDGRIDRIVNNYAQISFNFGPTLLAWMEEKKPEVYRAILEADELSRVRFGGHGSALAQPYHHAILPLANSRDKRTQILWGLADFERRFGRRAEGVWLPEAAVDLESLDILAAEGVKFTILEPGQASGPVDTTVPHEIALPSGRTLALFFYDGATSRAVAFEGLLSSGERFAQRLISRFPEEDDSDRLVHIATDGETYGHHHAYGEMALSYALHQVESNGWAKLTNYGAYLAGHPPENEVEIRENTSWSCAHGVERWRGDCGCHTGGEPGWNQAWRAPLREALDWLRDELIPLYEAEAGKIFDDPWSARDRYLLNRPSNTVRALELLEMQRHAMLMYTSCGWFFNDLAGIETLQVLQYAGRAVQLAQRLFGGEIEEGFLTRLERARSNSPEGLAGTTGRDLYERHVRPAMVDLPQVAVHYAVTALFQDYPDPARVYCYTVERRNGRTFQAGRARLSIGKALVTSGLTGDSGLLSYGVLHFGDHNLSAGVRAGDEDYGRLMTGVGEAFEHGDLAQVIRLLDRHFDGLSSSLRSLFRDEQRRVLDLILASTLGETEDELREMYLQHAPLMRFLNSLGTPLPSAFRAAAELVLNLDLKRALAGPADPDEVQRLLDETSRLGVALDAEGLSYVLERSLEEMVDRLRETPEDTGLLRRADTVADLARKPPFRVNLWRAQNRCYEMLETAWPVMKEEAAAGEAPAIEWVERFRALAGKLGFRVD